MKFRLSFPKTKRQIRLGFIFSLIFLGLLAFQNCAPSQQCSLQNPCASGSSSSTSPTTASSSNLVLGNTSSGSSSGFGPSSGAASSGGSVSSGGGSFGGSSSGGTPFTGASGTSSGTSGPLQITAQPTSLSIPVNQNFQFGVAVAGGTTPYSYQWYKNGVALTAGTYYFYADTAAGFMDAGSYYVVVTDAAHATVTSVTVQLAINDAVLGCNAGNYFTYTNATLDIDDFFENYFAGPLGKFLLADSFPGASTILSIPSSYSGLVEWRFPAMTYHQPEAIACASNIPRIHTATANPSTGSTADNEYYQYQGGVNFECQNNKLLFVSDTCHWVQIQAEPSSFGGGNDGGGGPN